MSQERSARGAWLRDAPALRAIAVFICALWGANIVASRVALNELTPLQAAAMRATIATATLLLSTVRHPSVLRVDRHLAGPLCVMTLLSMGNFICLNLALTRASASQVVVLLYLYPIFTGLLAHRWLVGEALTGRRVFGLCLGFLGTAFTLLDVHDDTHLTSLAGAALAMCSALIWATTTVYTKPFLSVAEPFALMLYPTAFSAVALLCASTVLGPPFRWDLSWSTLVALGYQGAVVGAWSNLAWIMVMKRVMASTLSSYSFLTPVFGVAASVMLLGEPLSPRLLAGLAAVTIALTLVDRRTSG